MTALVVLFVSMMVFAGCSRLDFVKPDTRRKGFERTAPEVAIRTDSRSAKDSPVRIQRARLLFTQGDLTAAESEARSILKADPTSVDAHTLLAVTLDRRGNAKAAGEHYRRAAELAPKHGAMLNNYGTWLCSNGSVEESLTWFERAMADTTYGTPAVALANAGVCADKAGQGPRAERYLRAALELDPANPVALGALAEHEFRAGRAFQARAFSERRLTAAPPDAQALLLASQIEEKLGDKAAAERYVQRMRAEFPSKLGSGNGDGSK